jgi:hypothetical protein
MLFYPVSCQVGRLRSDGASFPFAIPDCYAATTLYFPLEYVVTESETILMIICGIFID